MRAILFILSVFTTAAASAQYYYNDIIGTSEINQQMAVYVVNKVKTVSSTGYDRNGSKNHSFSEYQEVRNNGRELKVSNIANMNKTVEVHSFDNQGRVVQITDSTQAVKNSTRYEYNTEGRITKVQNSAADSATAFNHTEIHLWYYNSAGKPEKMWRILQNSGALNTVDSMEVRFTLDENGNVGEERTYKKGKETSYLYYYYDDKNKLSDVVRYNTRLKRLMPDLMFEYDDAGRVAQKITTTPAQKVGYLIWRYIYNDKGLKTKEALFNNDKQLTGKIEYSYTFGQ
jgi:YD repeat-containing protein